MSLETFAPLAQIVADAVAGKPPNPLAIARAVVNVGLDLVPVDQLRQYLDDEAKRRQDLAFEAAKDLKYGP